MPNSTYSLTTFGCQMNVSDSERIEALLGRMGLDKAESEAEADLILINSCSVRQTAEDRIFGRMQEYARLKEARAAAGKPRLIIGVTGCLPGRDADGRIRARLPLADLYFPIKDLPQLPRWLAELRPDLAMTGDVDADYLAIRPQYAKAKQAYVTIQTGCNKFCTYCVVPFARGLEKNRPVEGILNEIRERAERGVVEVTLLGQTVNAYRVPDRSSFSAANPYKDDFAALLWEVNQVAGLERIHYTAPHPVHMTDEVVDALALPKHLNYLHLPVQAGSDAVLKRMNRRYTRAVFLDAVRRVRARVPNIALGTDIIVGFCGESAEQFDETVSLYREADFDLSYTAQYSPRSGTAAYRAFKDDVAPPEKKRRWIALQGVMEEVVLRKNQAFIGREVEVLVDSWDHGVASGQTRELKLARFNCGEDLRGSTVAVRVTRAYEWMLSGELARVVRREHAAETHMIGSAV